MNDVFTTRRMLREAGIPDEWVSENPGGWTVQDITVEYATESKAWRAGGHYGRSLRKLLWMHYGITVNGDPGRRGNPAIGPKVPFNCPDALLTRIERYAEANGLNRAEAIRDLLGKVLDAIDAVS